MTQQLATSPAASAADGDLVATVAMVFRTFARIFPPTRVQADEKTMAVWERAMSLARLTPEQIRAGLARASQQPDGWPPSVGQFIALCRDDGAPTEAAALQEAVTWARGELLEWSHPAVGAAARDVGDWNFRNLPDRELRRLFGHTYREQLQRLARGEQLDAPVPRALTHETGLPRGWVGRRTPDSPVAAEHLERMRRHFRMAEEPAS